MKKIISTLFVAVALMFAGVQSTQAQLSWGVKGGLNLQKADFENASANIKPENFTGFFIGPMAKFTIPVLGLGLEADVLYSRSGTKIAGETIDKNSIEVPVYLRYDFALPLISKIAVPFIAVGPQFGFAVGSLDETIANVGEFEYKKSNLSLNLGLGAIVLSHIQLHVNYNIPMGKTSEWSGFNGVTGGLTDLITDSKTNTLQVSAAYLF